MKIAWLLMKAGFLGLSLQAGCTSHSLRTTPPLAPPAGATFLQTPDSIRLYTSIDGDGVRGVVWFVLGPEIGSRLLYPRFSGALRASGYSVAIVHPRGTGYSDGPRGDIDDYSRFLDDYRTFAHELRTRFAGRPLFLVGHSAGAALALEVAASSDNPIAGIVLVNPAYKLSYSDGMGPTFCDYLVYATNYLLRPAALTVDMNSNPEAVREANDRAEALDMQRDALVVRYFSMRYLFAQRAVMDRCVKNAKKTRAPVLLVEGARDALVNPAGSAEIYEAAATADKQRLRSPGGHGSSAVETVVTPLLEWFMRHSELSGSPGDQPLPGVLPPVRPTSADDHTLSRNPQ